MGIPAESARGAVWLGFPSCKDFDRIGAKNRMAAVEHGVGENGQIFGGGKQPGVSGNAAQDTGIFVLHRALDDAAAEGAIVGGGRDRRLQAGAGLNVVRVMPSGPKTSRWQNVARDSSLGVRDDAKNDEADVAVFGASARLVGERGREAACNNLSRVPARRKSFS